MYSADTALLRTCFTEDAILVHVIGYRQPLDEWLEGMDNQEFVYHQVIEKDVLVKVAGDTAMLTGNIITGYRADGSGLAWPLHAVQDFAQKGGRWLCTESRVTLAR